MVTHIEMVKGCQRQVLKQLLSGSERSDNAVYNPDLPQEKRECLHELLLDASPWWIMDRTEVDDSVQFLLNFLGDDTSIRSIYQMVTIKRSGDGYLLSDVREAGEDIVRRIEGPYPPTPDDPGECPAWWDDPVQPEQDMRLDLSQSYSNVSHLPNQENIENVDESSEQLRTAANIAQEHNEHDLPNGGGVQPSHQNDGQDAEGIYEDLNN